MSYKMKGKGFRTFLFMFFWLMFSLNLILTIFMFHSGVMRNGVDYVWSNYIKDKSYRDMKTMISGFPSDLNNLDEYIEQGSFIRQRGYFRASNLQYIISSDERFFSDIYSDNYDINSPYYYSNFAKFTIPYSDDRDVSYTFSIDEFEISHLDGLINDSEMERYLISKDDENYTITIVEDVDKLTTVTVRYYVPVDLKANDSYHTVYVMLSVIGKLRYLIIATMCICFLICAGLLATLVYTAGKSEKDSKTKARFVDKIPFDLFTLICVAIISFSLWRLYHCYSRFPMVVRMSSQSLYITLAVIICTLIGGIVLEYALTITIRIRKKDWFTNTIFYKLCVAIGKTTKAIVMAVNSKRSYVRALYIFIIFDLAMILMFGVMALITRRTSLLIAGIIIIVGFLAYQYIVIYNIRLFEKSCDEIASGNFDFDKAKKQTVVPSFEHMNASVNKLSDGMEVALNEKIKSEHFKTELITNVSHDIKTPLTSIISYVDLLKKKDISEEEKNEYLEVLSKQSAKLKKLITDLVETSKASTGNLELHCSEIDFKVIVEQSLAEYEDRFAKKNLKTVFNASTGGTLINADGQYLFRVIDNLLSNIFKYSMEGTRVYVDVISCYETVEVVFRNVTKYEIEATSDELMERFVRGDKSRNMEGSGLGLSIARNLIEAMGGKLYLDIDGDIFKSTVVMDRVKEDLEETEDGKEL